jgi:hypothetical protein
MENGQSRIADRGSLTQIFMESVQIAALVAKIVYYNGKNRKRLYKKCYVIALTAGIKTERKKCLKICPISL